MAAAARRLRQHGWHDFSLDSVARAAKVTRLTVYDQFGDRRGLLEAVFDAEATRGGLADVASAMAMDDPHAALARVVDIFCAFWSRSGAMQGVVAAAMADRELARAIHTRNERRRGLLGVLVARMVAHSELDPARASSLVDTLFALTSFSFYRELCGNQLALDEVARTIRDLVETAVARAARPTDPDAPAGTA